jgi:hypothetical protein
VHSWVDEEAADTLRTAILAGNKDQAEQVRNMRRMIEVELTGPLGSFGKPAPTPSTSSRPRAPWWWKGPTT